MTAQETGAFQVSDKRFNFTKSGINNLSPPPQGKRAYYRDNQVIGLSLSVLPSGHKSFYLIKKIKKKAEWIFLGKYPDLSIENVRNQARILLGQIATGANPNDEVRKERDEQTFGELFQEYMERYSKVHKKSWKYDQREVNKFLPHWFHRKISDIKKKEVRELVERVYKQNGLYQANRILERIRAIYNKAIEWDWEGRNPTAGIKKYKEKSRDRFVLPSEMPYLIQSLNEDENEIARDYFWTLLLTGARRSNTLAMRWEDISWELKLWRIPDTKNGDPHFVVLVDKAVEILEARRRRTNSPWVFPGHGMTDHFADPKRPWRRILQRATINYWLDNHCLGAIIKVIPGAEDYEPIEKRFAAIQKYAVGHGINLPKALTDIRIHDLRRTLGSYQAIAGASLQIIGQSLGHKSSQSTQIYARLTLTPVRNSIDNAVNTMLGIETYTASA